MRATRPEIARIAREASGVVAQGAIATAPTIATGASCVASSAESGVNE